LSEDLVLCFDLNDLFCCVTHAKGASQRCRDLLSEWLTCLSVARW
jgi:hypothetical protein